MGVLCMHFQWGQKFLPCFVGDFSILAPPSMGVLCWDIFLTHICFSIFFSVFVFFDQNPFIRGGNEILLNVALSWWFIFGLLFLAVFPLFRFIRRGSGKTGLQPTLAVSWSNVFVFIIMRRIANISPGSAIRTGFLGISLLYILLSMMYTM